MVDAFVDPTSSRGTGNPAAVVLLDSEPVGIDKAQWMQSVAHEFNLSETAFVWSMAQRKDEDGAVYSSVQYGIRYFTPTKEVPLCGHATLASAAVLFQTTLSDLPNAQVMIHTAEDVTLHACKKPSIVGSDNGRQCEITMTFPSKGFRELVSDDDILPVQSMLRVALNIDESDILYMGLADGLGDLLVEVTPSCFNAIGDTDDLNINALMYWDGYTRGVVVCCLMLKLVSIDGPLNDSRTISPVDFCSRFFGPKAGIPEDPVTGSAHCALAPYFASRLGKVSLVGRQMSSRGGFIQCELIHDFTCVDLTGTAAIVMSGELWM